MQTLPHSPQFCVSPARSTQAPLHRVSPDRHAQVPAWHDSASAHGVPQAPQLLGLVCVLTQAPPQVVPPAQLQVPPVQADP